MSAEMRALLRSCLEGRTEFVELRWHSRESRSLAVEKGRLEVAALRRREGVAVRLLRGGTLGFSSTSEVSKSAILAAVLRAERAADQSKKYQRSPLPSPAITTMATGDFAEPGVAAVQATSLEEKIELVRHAEAVARGASSEITTATSAYSEILDRKAIVTSDGGDCSVELVRPEFRVSAVALRQAKRQTAGRTLGVTGDFQCLFRSQTSTALATEAARTAVDLLGAGRPSAGRAKVILAPAIVGLLVHEAIGHTVEADFVMAGSVAAGKLGQRVGSELVTLADSGVSEFAPGAGGTLPIDDEGVPAGRTVIIRQGILESYLHDRFSAAHFGVAPTGSARAWEYSDLPLIRMRNTYLEPGTSDLEELVAGIDDGYILLGARNGQADATGEFMFNVERAQRIRGGKRAELLQGLSITGQAFEVLRSVDGVSREFAWDLGAGYCGKGQPAKVDAGGPWIRCEVTLGGTQ